MNEDKILSKLIEHDERLDRLESTMKDLKDQFQLFSVTLNKVMSILERMDQERIVMIHRIERIESDVSLIKQKLSLV